jgi:hypothetical protein
VKFKLCVVFDNNLEVSVTDGFKFKENIEME